MIRLFVRRTLCAITAVLIRVIRPPRLDYRPSGQDIQRALPLSPRRAPGAADREGSSFCTRRWCTSSRLFDGCCRTRSRTACGSACCATIFSSSPDVAIRCTGTSSTPTGTHLPLHDNDDVDTVIMHISNGVRPFGRPCGQALQHVPAATVQGPAVTCVHCKQTTSSPSPEHVSSRRHRSRARRQLSNGTSRSRW